MGMQQGFSGIESARVPGLPEGAGGRRWAAAPLPAMDHDEAEACFDRGVACSTGSHGAPCDLIEAHKWFNLAAAAGHEEAQACRAEVAGEMTLHDIAEALRRARAWQAARRGMVG